MVSGKKELNSFLKFIIFTWTDSVQLLLLVFHLTFKHPVSHERSIGNCIMAITRLLMKLSCYLTCNQSPANLVTQDGILIYQPENKPSGHTCMQGSLCTPFFLHLWCQTNRYNLITKMRFQLIT